MLSAATKCPCFVGFVTQSVQWPDAFYGDYLPQDPIPLRMCRPSDRNINERVAGVKRTIVSHPSKPIIRLPSTGWNTENAHEICFALLDMLRSILQTA